MAVSLKDAMKGVREQTPYELFCSKLEASRRDISAHIGDGLVEKFVLTARNAIQARPELLDADGRSLFHALREAAADGLLPNGHEAVLNIYNTKVKVKEGERTVEKWIKKVQYMPMVGGIIKKLYEAKIATFVDAVAVNQKDNFIYERGDNPRIVHIPYAGSDDPGPIIAAYAIVKLTNGEVKREVMFRRDIEKARAASKAGESGPWAEWYDQMAIKTVLHRVDKQLPSAPSVEQVMKSDTVASGYLNADMNLLPENVATEVPPTVVEYRNIGPGAEPVTAKPPEQEDPAPEHHEEPRAPVEPPPAPTEEQVRNLLEQAKDIDILDAHADLIRFVVVPAEEAGKKDNARARLTKVWMARSKELKGGA